MSKSNISAITIPGYRITEVIHVSTRTTVYRGEQEKTQTPVIIKTLNAQYPQLHELISLKNQFTITQEIEHPNIIKSYVLETYGNSYALILEDIDGISLHQYAKWQPLTLDWFFHISISIVEALEYLYQNKIIHKDIKPKNIIINPQTKKIKLIDFSISCLLPKEVAEIKNLNVLEGTLPYMSPEQTGRMNRGIDYRTDFYSLGVTLYELLTGQLPFMSNNPLELVHCHLAKTPEHPREINPQIPEIVADIILKLMAKTPEERYQTARGIRYDLEICQQMLLNQGAISHFDLGQRDIADRFIISDKIYGRENEIITLLDAFERVSNGNKELILVAGFSGIGKTAVINEIHKPIIRQKGYFISGKYDQFQRNIPLSALVKALQSLLQQLLTESTDKLQEWKNHILSALGEQGQVIIDVIPELENMTGKQPDVPELTGSAAQNRFNFLFGKFIQIFATKEHPLVIFLDDLQWADAASLKLIELLISETDTQYLLLIGAYRDNEVYTGHPLIITLDNISKADVIFNQINLQPLDKSHLNQLIVDTLYCPESETESLTELLLIKTQGNPFFTNQFMKSMYEDGLISFNFNLGYWQCDIYAAKALYQNDDIVEFLGTQIKKLPVDTQNILKIAACIGNQFDLYTLSIVCEKSQLKIATNLWNALKQGLILPQDESYKFYVDSADSIDVISLSAAELKLNNLERLTVKYKFLHDRVQQAAYFLIPDAEKQATHLKIGKLILKNTDSRELEERIFEIVNQLNISVELITNELDKYELAKLNLIAGQKAKLSTAYEAAVIYLRMGLELLAIDSWQNQYDLTLNLYVEAVEAQFLNINFDQAQTYIKIVKNHAHSLLDQVKVYEAEMQIYMAQVQIQLAIETGLNITNLLGVNLEKEPPENLNVDDLINLPVMTAPDKIAAMRILANMTAASYFVDPALFPAIIFTMIHLSVKYGNCSSSAHGYVNYGVILCGFFLDIDTGYRYGKLALNLLDKLDAKEIKCRVLVMWNANINFWKNHVDKTIDSLLESINCGIEVGDLEYAGYASAMYNINMILNGENLASIFQHLETYIHLMCNFKQEGTVPVHQVWKQFVLNFLDSNNIKKSDFSGNSFNESVLLPLLLETNSSTTLFSLYLAKSIFFYFFRNTEKSLESAVKGQEYLKYVVGQITVSYHNLYYSLSLLAEYPNQSISEQKTSLKTVLANQKQMQFWANHAPQNYQHKYDLVAAEIERVLGNNWQAMELYDQAIAGAKENKYIQEEAIANELAAQFYLESGKIKIAQTYLIDAYYCYVNWGAKAKVEDLEITYPQLLIPILKQKSIDSEEPNLISKLISDSSNSSVSAILDLETVTKASLAISSEIKIEKLLHTLLDVIVENTGAKKAVFILQQEGNLFVVPQYRENQKVELNFTQFSEHQNLPLSVINYVLNTQKDILINDATNEKTFAVDPYIIKYQPKSILCNPICNQGKVIGIIYLENDLTVGAFTPERLKVLKLLSSQAAISLENAQLYGKLEEKVANRTQELNEKNLHLEKTLRELQFTQLQLIQTEKMSSLGQLVAGIAHEINNPVNFIYGNIDHAQNYIEALINLLNLYKQEYPQPTSLLQQKMAEIDLDFLIVDLPKILSSMSVGADRIRNIVLGLRNFSRLDESEMKFVDIHEGIESTLMLLQPRFKEKLGYAQNIVIKDYGKLPLVICYASQLNQVFMNIISNAIDALYQHEQSLSKAEKELYFSQIKISTAIINNDWVKISIKDNAMGINPEIKQRIFDPFFTTKPVGEGTGLGLSISYQIIVDKHSGRIECLSEPGMGTEFIIQIPINSRQKSNTS
ncbi:serine/threonine kinase with two-component sensor domain protein [Sphaerospermopsis reniformis]|uniref:histidine kinase n=1 Tax=Sphaerospermopsis reniformis TaxID=531300 RepID=A0A479ZXF1_9CYAN|nr:ATP-binding sensor histidine kinase [Sphaerospermopsis reniformis]GCL37305.1 serine/threonine kinase with two-component sensor domain protein [Sphaerospermopsis reniformis]